MNNHNVTLGALFGAAFFIILMTVPFLFGFIWSGAHCEPTPECQREGNIAFFLLLLGLLICAGIIFVLVLLGARVIFYLRGDVSWGTAMTLGGLFAIMFAWAILAVIV